MSVDNVKNWRNNFKIRCLRLFDSKCNVCDYSKAYSALEFHHLDPSEKDFGISEARTNPANWDLVVSELRKCVCLCANCHREVHEGLVTLEIKQYLIESNVDYRLHEGLKIKCPCGVLINPSAKFCSDKCSKKDRHLVNWESLEIKTDILNLKENGMSFVKIAKIYNTSDKTISKWYKRYIS